MTRSEQIGKLAASIAKARLKFQPIGRDLQGQIGNRSYGYADLSTCLDAVAPALAEEGVALLQPVEVNEGGVAAETLLIHGESGEWMSSKFFVPVTDDSDAQSVGSAATYARRYGLISFLAVAPANEDDDGAKARGGTQERQSRPRAAPKSEGAPPRPQQQQLAQGLTQAARDKQIFEDALRSGVEREQFHSWAEMVIARSYKDNKDWTDGERAVMEAEISARLGAGGRQTT